MVADDLRRASVEACTVDLDAALRVYDDAGEWFAQHAASLAAPLAAEVWVYDPAFSHVVLVHHRWRQWVPPGGKIEDGETPSGAAVRETAEETGMVVELMARPVAAAVRSFHPDWPATLSLSYAAVADPHATLRPEDGQPAAWWPLEVEWGSAFPDDRRRMIAFAASQRRDASSSSHPVERPLSQAPTVSPTDHRL
ncbi:MAG: NUDIX domain-containing protein [Actinomycetota bacterium]